MIFALAAGVLMSNGDVARLTVFHDGAPVQVRIVGYDKDFNEVPIQAFPATLKASRRPCTVRVKFPPATKKLCAVFSSPSVLVLSCSGQLNLRELSRTSNLAPTAQGGFLSTLKRALGAPATEPIDPPSQLLVVPTQTETPPSGQ